MGCISNKKNLNIVNPMPTSCKDLNVKIYLIRHGESQFNQTIE